MLSNNTVFGFVGNEITLKANMKTKLKSNLQSKGDFRSFDFTCHKSSKINYNIKYN